MKGKEKRRKHTLQQRLRERPDYLKKQDSFRSKERKTDAKGKETN